MSGNQEVPGSVNRFKNSMDIDEGLKPLHAKPTKRSAPKGKPGKKVNHEPATKRANPGNVSITSSITPTKAPRDNNEYRVVTLSNGLRAVLIKEDAKQATFPMFHHSRRIGIFGLRQFQAQQLLKSYSMPYPTDLFGFSHLYKRQWTHDCMSNYYGTHSRKIGCRPTKSSANAGTGKYASVCLCVNAGFFNDPEDFQGLAHFTEHVVHYGSHKYPEEEAFGRLTMNFGLQANAFTEENTTTYFYTVKDKFLSKSLDLFANLILDPTFDEDMIRRELESIDNEFILKSHDFCNHYLLYQSMAKEGHPFRSFGWGDRRTLNKSPEAIKQAMQEFHKQFYVPSAMTLCVQGNTSLDTLESLVLQHFGCHSNKGKHPIRRLTKTDPSFLEPFQASCNSFYKMEGCGNKNYLFFRWMLPPEVWKNTKNKTLAMIIDLLGDEGENGLSQHLKNDGLVIALEVDCCPCDHHWNDYNTMIDLRMVLTDRGFRNTGLILSACHTYLNFLADTPFEVLHVRFNQLKTGQVKNYNYGGPGTSLVLAISAARNLQRHEAVDIFTADSWIDAEFNYDKLLNTLRMLNSTNLIVIQILASGQQLPGNDIREEKFSKVKFAKHPNKLPVLKSNVQFHLNTDFQPIEEQVTVEDHGYIIPEKLDLLTYECSGEKMTANHFGHDPDTIFKAEVHIELISKFYSTTALTHTLTKLWTNCIQYKLQPLVSQFERMGYYIGVWSGPDSISLKIQGFPDKMEEVTQIAVNSWLLSSSNISEQIFKMSKQVEMLTTDVVECGIMDSWRVTKSIMNYVGDIDVELMTDTSGLLQEITYTDLTDFIEECRNSSFIFVEGMGNLPISSMASIMQELNDQEISPSWHNPLTDSPLIYPLHLPLGERCIRIQSECMTSRCTMITNVYQFGNYEPLMHYMCVLVEAFMVSEAFHNLRLKEQLGYFVATSVSTPGFPMSLCVTITATAAKYTPCELDAKIDKFLRDFETYFSRISPTDYSEMTQQLGIPPPITKEMVRQCLFSKLRSTNKTVCGDHSTKWESVGISKTSVQVLGLHGKKCHCPRCCSITDWTKVRGWLKLAKVQSDGQGDSSCYFIHDLSALKNACSS